MARKPDAPWQVLCNDGRNHRFDDYSCQVCELTKDEIAKREQCNLVYQLTGVDPYGYLARSRLRRKLHRALRALNRVNLMSSDHKPTDIIKVARVIVNGDVAMFGYDVLGHMLFGHAPAKIESMTARQKRLWVEKGVGSGDLKWLQNRFAEHLAEED